MEIFISQLAGLLVWVVANVVYADKRRRASKGFARLLAFWFGLPVTFFSMLIVEEGSQPVVEPPPDDEAALLAEVRRARAERIEPRTGESRTDKGEEGT